MALGAPALEDASAWGASPVLTHKQPCRSLHSPTDPRLDTLRIAKIDQSQLHIYHSSEGLTSQSRKRARGLALLDGLRLTDRQ